MEVVSWRHDRVENLLRYDHCRAEGDQATRVYAVRWTGIQEFATVAGMNSSEVGIVATENTFQMRRLRIAGQQDDFAGHDETYHGYRDCDSFYKPVITHSAELP